MANVYVLLTRSQTLLSRSIHLFTGDRFTHASIALDGELRTLYSFARKHPYLPLPAGLVHEDLLEGYWSLNRYVPCALLTAPLSDDEYAGLQGALARMLAAKEQYRYDLRGLICCRLGIERSRKNHYFCSMFVASLLQECSAVALTKKPSIMRPQDFMEVPGLSCVYRGMLSGLMHPALRNPHSRLRLSKSLTQNSL